MVVLVIRALSVFDRFDNDGVDVRRFEGV